MAQFTKGNKGKPPGAVNKTTKSAREAFQLAFDSSEAMTPWWNGPTATLRT